MQKKYSFNRHCDGVFLALVFLFIGGCALAKLGKVLGLL